MSRKSWIELCAEESHEPGYYDHGYYRDNDWYWHDRAGHEFHEAPEEHERRMRDWGGHHDRG